MNVSSAVAPGTQAVVVSVDSASFAAEFCRGVVTAARQHKGVSVFFGERAKLLTETRAASSADLKDLGMICSAREFALMTEVGKRRMPCVVWDDGALENWKLDPTRPVSICAVDNEAVGRMAAAHFLRRQVFRSFVYADSAAEAARDWWARTRGRSFGETIGFARCVSTTHLVVPELPCRSAVTALANRLRAMPGPVAVFACSGRVARNLMNICRECALRVPADLAILGVEGAQPWDDAPQEGISAVRLDSELMGSCALRLLRELQRGFTGRKELLRPLEVVERDSTFVRPTDNPYVNLARSFIATAPIAALSSRAVVARCGTSKSYLTYWFRELTGRSILETIHDRILSEVREQLLTTSKSMREISAFCGIGTSTLCTLFKHTYGMTTRQFRAHNHPKAPRTRTG